MEFVEAGQARVIVARFDEGDDLLDGIIDCVSKNNIKSGSFELIGGLKDISYGLYYKGERKEFSKKADECFEILFCCGNITRQEGKPLVHAHITAANEKDGGSFGGHLMTGSIVYPFAELCIREFDIAIDRFYDENLKLWPMKLK